MCGCRNKWRGPPWDHEAGGAPSQGGRALDPCGQVAGPPGVFSVLIILTYSRKNHMKFSGDLENFYFRGIFIARIFQKILFFLYLI